MWRRSGGKVTKRSELFVTMTAAVLIAVRRDAGEEDKVDEVVAAIKDNVRRYREAGIVCDDNPYEAVWQPAEGTCERFASSTVN